MRAIHINWTRPFFARNPGASFELEPFELLTTMLSALEWRRQNGSISMLTDRAGAMYYASLHLTNLWDGGIHPVLEGQIPDSVSPHAFWAAGKLYALRTQRAPCVMIDTDFIVWKPLQALCQSRPLVVIHREPIDPGIYPDRSAFRLCGGPNLRALDWTVEPCNTALCYFGDNELLQYYTRQAISFMEHAPQADDPLTYMVFAEQRLLAMCAAQRHIPIASFSELEALFTSGQQLFTHVWGFKQQMRDNPAVYEDFCRRCAARLEREFPAFAQRAHAIVSLARYFS